MAYPANLQTVTAQAGPYLDGPDPVAGVEVALTPQWPLTHGPTGAVVLAVPATGVTDVSGMASIEIPASDAANLLRTNVRYLEVLTFPRGLQPPREPRFVFLPAASPVIDLDQLDTVQGPDGSYVSVPYAVVSVAGYTAAVSAAQLATALGLARLVPFWTASEALAAGAIRVAPDGTTIQRNAGGTARPSYDATEAALWTVRAGASGSLAPTATKTGAYTVARGELAVMDVPNGGAQLALPAAPSDGDRVGFWAIGATTAVPLAVTRGGTATIGSSAATSVTVPLAGEVTVYQYQAAGTRWVPVDNVKPLTALDSRFLKLADVPTAGTPTGDALRAAFGRPTSTDGTNSLPAPTGVGLEFVITASGLQDIRLNGASL